MTVPIYLHSGHSSVQILPSGMLKEVRRGIFTGSKIVNPYNWFSYNDWIQFANQLQIEYDYDSSWTNDQKWLAQWFRHETLKVNKNNNDEWNSICNRIFELRENFMMHPTNRIKRELNHYESLYEKIYNNKNNHYLIVNSNSPPKILLQDQFGYLHGLYMCLETGAIAIDSAKHVGTSFAELGIQPTAVFNREFGVYYRVL